VLSHKTLLLASQFLDDHADRLSNDGCNDWEFPADWTVEEKTEFVKGYHEWNGDPEEFNPNWLCLPNFAVAAFLSAILKRTSELVTQKPIILDGDRGTEGNGSVR
jgi:hypothetical protein